MTKAPSTALMPDLADLTENERGWIGFLRLISNDTDPAPTLARVQGVRRVFAGHGSTCSTAMSTDPEPTGPD
jgi:hypothetical protein